MAGSQRASPQVLGPQDRHGYPASVLPDVQVCVSLATASVFSTEDTCVRHTRLPPGGRPDERLPCPGGQRSRGPGRLIPSLSEVQERGSAALAGRSSRRTCAQEDSKGKETRESSPRDHQPWVCKRHTGPALRAITRFHSSTSPLAFSPLGQLMT